MVDNMLFIETALFCSMDTGLDSLPLTLIPWGNGMTSRWMDNTEELSVCLLEQDKLTNNHQISVIHAG